MVRFIDAHRAEYGVEPICAELPIGRSTHYELKARQADPERQPARARRDAELAPEIESVWQENFRVYGARKGLAAAQPGKHIPAACWTVERLMGRQGLSGVVRGRTAATGQGLLHHSDPGSTCPLATPSDWPKPVSNPLSPASATPTTTAWPGRSSGCTRPKSSTNAHRCEVTTRSNTRHTRGWTGSTIGGCSSRSARCRRSNARGSTIGSTRVKPRRPDSRPGASGEAGAVQHYPFIDFEMGFRQLLVGA